MARKLAPVHPGEILREEFLVPGVSPFVVKERHRYHRLLCAKVSRFLSVKSLI